MALDLGIFLEGAQSTFKVKVSDNDAQAQYLIDKLISSDGSVTITETNDGGIETIDLTTSGGGGSDTNIANTDLTNDANHSVNLNTFKQGFTNGELGIGTATPDNSSQLEVSATDKGLLIPRVTTAQMNAISTPATNLLVFNTDLEALYRYDGANWVALSAGYGVIEVITDADSGIPTYFTDLQSALETCKTSGSNNVVRLCSDITITSAISIKSTGSGTGLGYDFESLTIDFNGFRVVNNEADGSYCFDVFIDGSTASNRQLSFVNGQVIRTSGTTASRSILCDSAGHYGGVSMNKMIWYNDGGVCADFRMGSVANYMTSINDWGGSVFQSDTSFAIDILGINSTYPFKVRNFTAIGNSANIALYSRGNVEASHFTAYNLSTGDSIYVKSTSNLSHFSAYSTSGNAIEFADDFDGVLSNFYAQSTTGDCIYMVNSSNTSYSKRLSNFTAVATSGSALRVLPVSVTLSNFTAINNGASQTIEISGTVDIHSGYVLNRGSGQALTYTGELTRDHSITSTDFISVGDQVATITCDTAGQDIDFVNCTFESRYDDATGYAVEISNSTGNISFANCMFKVFNASANGLYASSAKTIAVGNCGFKGATTSINANVTVSLTSAPDANGNYDL
jgi:hypothetical protein